MGSCSPASLMRTSTAENREMFDGSNFNIKKEKLSSKWTVLEEVKKSCFVWFCIQQFVLVLQHMEVLGVCSRQDRRAKSEGFESEAARNLRLHLPPTVVWRTATQTSDSAQVKHRVCTEDISGHKSITGCFFNQKCTLSCVDFVCKKEREAAMDRSHVSIKSSRRHWASQWEWWWVYSKAEGFWKMVIVICITRSNIRCNIQKCFGLVC